MVAIELKGRKGIASAVTKAAASRDVLLMTAGARECVRFLPCLTVNAAEVDACLSVLDQSLREATGK
jgi:4-aminobutyrate aminotransferase